MATVVVLVAAAAAAAVVAVAVLSVIAAVGARARVELMAARRSRPGLRWGWRGRLSRLMEGDTPLGLR